MKEKIKKIIKKEDLCRRFVDEGIALALLEHKLSPEQENFWLKHIEKCESCMAVIADVLYADSQMKSFSLALNIGDITQTQEQEKKHMFFKLDDIEVESELKEDLFDEANEMLLARGTLITPAILEILTARGIQKVRYREPISITELAPEETSTIEDEPAKIEVIAEEIAEQIPDVHETWDEPAKTSQDFNEGFFFADEMPREPRFKRREYVSLMENITHREAVRQETKLRAVNTLEEALKTMQEGSNADLAPVRDVAQDVVSQMLADESKTLSLMDLFLFNSKIYSHSFNTLVVFTALAKVFDFKKGDIIAAGEAVLMHDVGKIIHPADEDKNPDVYRNHPMTGYRHLMKHGGFNEKMLTIVLNHHERFDGKGFPRGIKGEKLGIMEQIMIVANVYDMAITDPLHNVKRDFHAAAQMIYQSPNVLVSSEITTTFLNIFGIYPPGTYVKLRSGEEGIVREANYQRPFQPMITLLRGSKGVTMPEPLDIDLRELENSSIERALDIAPLLENQNA
jgi:HD-GYP domain-containing protein (c-di-GMP phosphodiesterase class II)